MTTPRNWTERELDTVFNRAVQQIEGVARDFAAHLVDVGVSVDSQSLSPIINFVFAGNSQPDLHRMPHNINGHRVTTSFKK